MGRIFISTGQGSIKNGYSPWGTQDSKIDAREILLLRDLALKSLRSHSYEVLSAPDHFTSGQTIDWINDRSCRGDIALELQANDSSNPRTRGAAAFYIANNDQRKAQAEQLLQSYLRRVPQMPSRGVKPDTQTKLGQLAFCRQVSIPSVVIEVGCLKNLDDRRIIQSQYQEIALGIAEGLATWNYTIASDSAHEPTKPLAVNIDVNGAMYEDPGILIDGNVYIPIDLIDQLGLDLPLDAPVRRVSYHHVVFVRAIDLREFNLSISYQTGKTPSVTVRSIPSIYTHQLDRIMGQGSTSEVQMLVFLKSNHPDGLARFPDLPKLYREEAGIEGVNHDIAFAQMCVETNFLHFSHSLRPEQNNFAGLGATDREAGASFSSPRLGIRSHIQHLKAYASTEPLVQAIVDPRFHSVRRGVAPSIGQLSGRWSANPHYHTQILSVLRRLYESAGFF